MTKRRRIIGTLVAGGVGAIALSLLIHPDIAQAAGIVGDIPDKGGNLNQKDVENVLVQIIQWALMFASAIGAIFIVVNGYQYIISAGNPEKIEKAKQGLTWSIGGFILAISSYAIVLVIVSRLGSNQLKNSIQGHQPGGVPASAAGILTSIANVLFIFAGAVAVLFLILGGYRYVTSQGNEDLVEKAKKTILYAVIGLILVFASASLFNFIATQLKVT